MIEPSVELALADLSRKIEVGFAKTDGQLALLLQRTEAMERRADGQDAAIAKLDERLDSVESTRVTRDELGKRTARTLQFAAVIVAVVGIITSAATAFIVAIVFKGS